MQEEYLFLSHWKLFESSKYDIRDCLNKFYVNSSSVPFHHEKKYFRKSFWDSVRMYNIPKYGLRFVELLT